MTSLVANGDRGCVIVSGGNRTCHESRHVSFTELMRGLAFYLKSLGEYALLVSRDGGRWLDYDVDGSTALRLLPFLPGQLLCKYTDFTYKRRFLTHPFNYCGTFENPSEFPFVYI